MALEQWALPQLRTMLPLGDEELKQVISYTGTLPEKEATQHLSDLLGHSPMATDFIASYTDLRSKPSDVQPCQDTKTSHLSEKQQISSNTSVNPVTSSSKVDKPAVDAKNTDKPPPYSAPPATSKTPGRATSYHHTNNVIEAGKLRAVDEVCQSNHTRKSCCFNR
jgi:hypothetical protein